MYPRVCQHHPRLCGIFNGELRLSALQDRQPDSSQGTYNGSSPQIKLSISFTLLRQHGYCKVIALYLPCQIYALCSGTDARHAASAQEKTAANHNSLCLSDPPRHVCES